MFSSESSILQIFIDRIKMFANLQFFLPALTKYC